MVEVLSHFLGFFIGFTLTLDIIGSILYYIKPDSRKSTYFIWDFHIRNNNYSCYTPNPDYNITIK